ncbi:hypothetical protein ABVT39_018580 [Epinephelus coioides]
MTTNLRQPITPTERLAICLRFLATGDSYTTIASSYRMRISTVAGIVPEVCQEGTLDLPEDAPLPGADHLGPMPHTFVADEAFPLKRNLLRPYPGRNLSRSERIFNYRLSRARRVVENAFGILAAQWRIYHRVTRVKPDNTDWIVKATVALHSFQRWNSTPQADLTLEAEGPPALPELRRVGSNHASRDALAVREKFTTYFLSAAGEVPWQNNLA